MNTQPQTGADIAAEIIANMKRQFDVHALVEDARVKLGVAPSLTPGDAKTIDVVGAQAIVVNNLLAKAAELERIAKAAIAELEEVKQALADYAGDAEVLKVNGAMVFTYKPQTARVLNQAWIKATYPDIPGNEKFWTDQTTRPRRFR